MKPQKKVLLFKMAGSMATKPEGGGDKALVANKRGTFFCGFLFCNVDTCKDAISGEINHLPYQYPYPVAVINNFCLIKQICCWN